MSARFRRTPGGWYVADTAVITADVRIGANASFWFGSVVRGDVALVEVGAGTNVQDNAVIHCDSGRPNRIGRNVTVGHGAIVHGVEVGDGSLIGMGAKLLGESIIGRDCLVAAGALVPPRMKVPERTLVAGMPARIVREVTEADLAYMRRLPPHYVRLAQQYAAGEIEEGGRPLGEENR